MIPVLEKAVDNTQSFSVFRKEEELTKVYGFPQIEDEFSHAFSFPQSMEKSDEAFNVFRKQEDFAQASGFSQIEDEFSHAFSFPQSMEKFDKSFSVFQMEEELEGPMNIDDQTWLMQVEYLTNLGTPEADMLVEQLKTNSPVKANSSKEMRDIHSQVSELADTKVWNPQLSPNSKKVLNRGRVELKESLLVEGMEVERKQRPCNIKLDFDNVSDIDFPNTQGPGFL